MSLEMVPAMIPARVLVNPVVKEPVKIPVNPAVKKPARNQAKVLVNLVAKELAKAQVTSPEPAKVQAAALAQAMPETAMALTAKLARLTARQARSQEHLI